MQEPLPPAPDELTLESLEQYVVAGPDALRDPQVARALAGRVDLAQRLRTLCVALRSRPRGETDRSLRAALQRIGHTEQGVFPLPGRRPAGAPTRAPRQPRWFHRTAWSTTTAVVAGVVLMALGWSIGVHHTSRRVARAASVYSTKNGERADIVLPDGSRVSLNVASRLEVPADYAAGNRTVNLVGQALFTVPHRPGSPFTVVAGGATARVLGTSFMVRHYAADTSSIVAVREGRVAVHAVVLTAAREVAVTPRGVGAIQPARQSEFTFATGIMTLDSMPLSGAIASLDRWYDVDVRVADPALETQQIKGEFAVGSVAELANILELTFNVRVVRNGRVLTLYPQGK